MAKHNYHRVMKEGQDDVTHPVLAYFGTSRLAGGGRNTLKDKPFREVFKDGYDHWYDMQFNTFQYERWFRNHKIQALNGREPSGLLEAFLQAIEAATPMIELRTDGGGGELWFKSAISGNETDYLPISYHSDGLRTYVSMVAEIAYRCIALNMHLAGRAIQESPGIVLIDELDMHLHPSWQKHVVEDLKRAFPQIQFVATTHSPFIVQSLEAGELINLDEHAGSSRIIPAQGPAPHDLSLSKVVTDIMQVDSLKSDDFEERYQAALGAFQELQRQGHQPSMEYYQKLRDIMSSSVAEDSNDPVYKAYLVSKNATNPL
jgi:predicted ATP-binding protein involved in virulence